MSKRSKFDLDSYHFIVRPLSTEDGGGYLLEYPEVQRCIADGEMHQQAIANGRVALEACLTTLADLNLPIPQPGASGSSGQWRQRVPKSLHARLVERAAREGVSLNTLVTAMIAEGIGKRDKANATNPSSTG